MLCYPLLIEVSSGMRSDYDPLMREQSSYVHHAWRMQCSLVTLSLFVSLHFSRDLVANLNLLASSTSDGSSPRLSSAW